MQIFYWFEHNKVKTHGTFSEDNWISIKERLPDYDEQVLWVREDGIFAVAALDKDGNPWLEPDDKEMPFHTPAITHWKPIRPLN